MNNKKHQHKIWIQYHLEADHAVLSYGYHESGPHQLPEQRIEMKISELDNDLRQGLNFIHDEVVSKIPEPSIVRLPHVKIKPTISFGYFTLAALDQDRADELPLCRLYYHEDIHEIPSRVEKYIRIKKPEMTDSLLKASLLVSRQLRKIVWLHYKNRFQEHFIDD